MIQNDAQLRDFLTLIKDESELAIDTEFKRVDTYYPVLCLVQIATNTFAECIDVLAIDNLEPLFEKLYQPNLLWIVHSARQDIEAMYQLSNRLPQQLFDTQIAASLLGYPIQVSYQALTESLQGIHLEKTYTRLDWTMRPLPEGAVEYALDDVRYLIKNYRHLHQQLRRDNKLSWLQEDSQNLLRIDLYQAPIEQAWRRTKGISRLGKKHQALGIQLCALREHQAQRNNKPRKWIFSDEDLIAYALKKQKLHPKLEQARLKIINTHPQLQTPEYCLVQHKPPTKAEKLQKTVLQKIIQEKANQYNLAVELIASSKSLLKYIRGDRSLLFCQGWRYHLLQKELKKCKIV